MASSLDKALVRSVAAAAALALGLALAGCAEQGKTPVCEDNLTEDGMQKDPDPDNDKEPCFAFGYCIVDGDRAPAAECCVDENGDPFTGGRLDACLYAFGAYEPPAP